MEASDQYEGGTTLLLFGPQALSFPEESIQRLRTALKERPENSWMLEVLAELPECTRRVSEHFPKLRAAAAKTSSPSLSLSLSEWLLADEASATTITTAATALPNALLTPLVVLDQLVQYTQYVQFAHVETGLGCDLYAPQPRRLRTLGFCTGLLSALAASSAASEAEFRKYGAVSVRLAAIIGQLVDAEEIVGPHAASKSLSTACRSSEQEVELQRILQDFPEAYISVNYDLNRATITTSERSVDRIQKRFQSAGITATIIGLRGRFHCRDYSDDLQTLLSLCDTTAELQLPDAADAVIPVHSLSDGELTTEGKLHHIALREILVEQSQWGRAFDAASRSSLGDKRSFLVSFGSERCVPPAAMPRVSGQLIYMTNPQDAASRLSAIKRQLASNYSDDDIAVVGMACKLAGADDVDEFWHLNCAGKSQHVEVPAERFTFETPWRTVDPKRKWYGNFLRDQDAFDHKFFQKSPREAATQDPQQRLFLQSAYQAVEQSGYFNTSHTDRNVGVYVGVCAADYEANIACYTPNAFSATGNLKSFIAGKISHYFGWHGPGLTIDTACSASAVAIHQACRAILGGECTAALAGGTNVMTSPTWFQNLAGASFLSPTGASKPFDAKADGYCRGEGVACVFLKKMSKAIEDGDLVIGCIRSTAVYQNDNCTPIFVPNAPSLSSLFENVVSKAGLQPKDITLVEAHGTGTPVGDPAEYESILKVFGGKSVRSKPMPIGSVKGLIGHTECTSGVVALIKVLTLIHHGLIPPQASFQTLSPRLKASPEDMLQVVTEKTPWDAEYRAALINNYGASGSNASMIVAQPPKLSSEGPLSAHVNSAKCAFWLTGLDERSIREYARRLKSFLSLQSNLSLPNLAFNLYRQSNRTLSQGLVFSCGSVGELESHLSDFVEGRGDLNIISKKSPRPIILCFGGQISRSIGLDKSVFESTLNLRKHLDRCNTIIQSLGLDGLYPTIFEKTEVEDPVHLQTMLFSLQYSCAQCWIDCGIQPAAVVGHSFGELTALCVAGVLSLKDSIRVVSSRARLIKDAWGSDSGAMMAVEGKLEDVQSLLEQAGKVLPAERPTIACFNGPTTFTLAGSTRAMDSVGRHISSMPGLRSKKLAVSNAFHSTLVEPLRPELEKVGRDVTFRKPMINWHRATEMRSSPEIGPGFFASHMRDPVFADHAFQRLHRDFPSAVWLEAGSNSTITKMAERALKSPATSSFVDVNIACNSGSQKLTDSFVKLWKEGVTVEHWAHHRTQASLYSPILLPPYQFEKSRHWLELKSPQPAIEQVNPTPSDHQQELPTSFYTFIGYQDDAERSARFRINTMIQKYVDMVFGHFVAQTAPICPATLEVDIVIEALFSLRTDFASSGLQPEIRTVENLAPICVDPSRMVWLDLQASTPEFHTWDWCIISTNAQGSSKTTHVKGQLVLRGMEDKLEFARYERLMSHRRCLDILNDSEPDDVLLGRNVYKVFAEIVDYAEPYQGLQKLVGKGSMSAGRVVKKHSNQTWLDTHLSDCFSQVGGFWVNCMTDRAPSDMYIAAGFESWLRKPGSVTPVDEAQRNSVWDVMACHDRTSDKAFTTDIFIFEAATGTLHEMILGIHYARIPKSTMSKTLTKLTATSTSTSNAATAPLSAAATIVTPAKVNVVTLTTSEPSKLSAIATPELANSVQSTEKKATAQKIRSQTVTTVIEVLVELSGIDADAIKPPMKLADIGIDSLVGMEMVHDLESKFDCSLDLDQMAEVVTVQDVVQIVDTTLGVGISAEEMDYEDSSLTCSSRDSESSRDDVDSSTSESVIESMASTDMNNEMKLAASHVLEAFGETKRLTDQFITDFNCSGYMDKINPKQTQLCIALIIEAFEKLDCNFRTAKAGDRLPRISHAPQHGRLIRYLYDVLENEGRLINVIGDDIIRTAVSVPHKSSKEILDGLVANYPDHNYASQLAFFCGTRLVEVLKGELDGVKLIFGDVEGRRLVSGLYGDSLLNKIFYEQMEDFLKRLVSRLPPDSGPLKILEMGAGTGGTTKYLVPLLARLEVPVEYTFTDLAPSFIAAARRQFNAYSFMKFRVHDIEKEPAEDLIQTQHIIVASNAVHATHSLTVSLGNMRKALRPDGFLMMLEMTQTLPWVDIIFGILEGWWLFDDGRLHAISHQTRWEKELHALGYGHVDWTDGHLPENNIQRIIVAMASGPKIERLPIPTEPPILTESDTAARAHTVDEYVRNFTAEFIVPTQAPAQDFANGIPSQGCQTQCILVTGATGSLGAHIVADLASRPDIHTVICLNRIGRSGNAEQRQRQSLAEKGLELESGQLAKLRFIETDSSKPRLGLSQEQYQDIARTVTAVIHNAWPMSGVRPVRAFNPQFAVMRNLLDLVRDAAAVAADASRPVTFQFVSSIAVVGHHPLWSGNANVPEERVGIESVLPNGYGDAKYVCERMLDATLHKHPSRFRTMSVRLGQVAGSSKTGYWNTLEHLSFLIKSSQTLRALPDFSGPLSWTPVDVVASTLVDLVLGSSSSGSSPSPIYHIDNPIRQPWQDMIPVLARALGIPATNVLPFTDWVRRVRRFPGSVEKDNPAFKLIDFLDGNFLRMSCGGLLLDTTCARQVSPSLSALGPVSVETAEGYIRYWKRINFLHV